MSLSQKGSLPGWREVSNREGLLDFSIGQSFDALGIAQLPVEMQGATDTRRITQALFRSAGEKTSDRLQFKREVGRSSF